MGAKVPVPSFVIDISKHLWYSLQDMKFQIYSKDNCQFCTKAVALLTIKQLDFEELKLGKEFTREELFEIFPDAKQFPQIRLTTGEYIGGFTQLQKFVELKGL